MDGRDEAGEHKAQVRPGHRQREMERRAGNRGEKSQDAWRHGENCRAGQKA